MSAAPLVSVLIPTFNRARLVVEAVENVLKQTHTPLEIIVVDDGSTDDTAAALQPYADRIRYVRQDNRGVNAARNAALDLAQGEYVALLDSDDLWIEPKIEFQLAVLDASPGVGFTFSDFFILRSDGSVAPRGLQTWHTPMDEWIRERSASRTLPVSTTPVLRELGVGEVQIHTGDVYHYSLFDPYVLPSTTLIRRGMIGSARFPENDSTCGDWEFYARLSHQGGCVFTNIETTYNRSHEDAVRLTRLSATVQLSRRIAMIDRVWGADPHFKAGHATQIAQVQRQLLGQLGWMLLLDSKPAQARVELAKAAALSVQDGRSRLMALRVLAAVPGSGALLNGAKGLRSLLLRSH